MTEQLTPVASCRTWHQWSRLMWVRIVAAVALIHVIALTAFWMPRRGLLILKLAGARIELIHPLQHRPLVRSIPFGWSPPIRLFLGRNNQRVNWLGTDDDVGLVGLNDVGRTDRWLETLHSFPNLRTLILDEGPSKDWVHFAKPLPQLRRVFINGSMNSIDLDGLSPFVNLEELKLSTVSSVEFSDQALHQLNRLHRLDIYKSALTNSVFVELGRLTEFCGTLALNRCQGINQGVLRQLASMARLARLELNYCESIGDAELLALREFRQLRFLSLRETQASAVVLEQLKQDHPQCTIEIR